MTDSNTIDLPVRIVNEDVRAIVSFWWTSTLLKRLARRFFKGLGSSEAFFNFLMVVKKADGPVTQSELSQRLLVDKSNVTGLLDRLASAGLVRRNPVAGDRRSYHVTLTDRGHDVVDELDRRYAETAELLMGTFTATERSEMIRLTHKLRTALADSGL